MPTKIFNLQFINAAAEMTDVDLKDLKGVAYSGGDIKQSWSYLPMVIDLKGLKATSQTPILYNHINDPAYRLGELTPEIAAKNIKVTGSIDASSPKGAEVIRAGQKCTWQASVGVDPQAAVYLEKGEKMEVNGRNVEGPRLIITKSLLRHVAVVAVGADAETHLEIAAALNMNLPENNLKSQGEIMDKNLRNYIIAKFKLAATANDAELIAHLTKNNTTVEAMRSEWDAIAPLIEASASQAQVPLVPQAPQVSQATAAPQSGAPQINAAAPIIDTGHVADIVKDTTQQYLGEIRAAEDTRIKAINEACNGYPEIQAMAVSNGWTAEVAKNAIEAVKQRERDLPPAGNIIIRNGPEINANVIEAAFCQQIGIHQSTLEASYNEQTLEQTRYIRGIGLKGLMIECCRIDHISVGMGFENETIRAAFSSVSLPGILSNVANKKALQAFQAQPIIALKLCSEGDLNDFKTSDRYRLTDVGDLEEISPDGEIKHKGLTEEKAQNKLKTYGKVFFLTCEMIYNDDMQQFVKIPNMMGNRAARKIDQLFFQRLMSNPIQADGKPLFSADHKNYFGGASSALGIDSLKKGITMFLDQTDADGEPIAVEAKYLLVPTVLDADAKQMVLSAVLIGGTQTQGATNIVSKYGLEPLSSPYLNNAKYPNHSETGWYLFGDPNQVDTFEIGYLQGHRTPTVERGDTDFTNLGMGFRVFYDLGLREQDHRGMLRSNGKA